MDELGSSALTEAELAEGMECCAYPGDRFHHPDHLRLAWHYLRTGREEAVDRMRRTIRNFADSLGHPEKYHDTATIAWMRLVAAAMACTPQALEFAPFLASHPWLLDRDRLLSFYSSDCLRSSAARGGWVEPDLHPLP